MKLADAMLCCDLDCNEIFTYWGHTDRLTTCPACGNSTAISLARCIERERKENYVNSEKPKNLEWDKIVLKGIELEEADICSDCATIHLDGHCPAAPE